MPRPRLIGSSWTLPLSSQSGQTAIFVFVLLLVGLTIGLSVAGRTFRDLQSSGSSDFSARAFTAAEAGAEEALRQDLTTVSYGTYVNSSVVAPSFGTTNKSNFKYKVDKLSYWSGTIAEDDSAQIQLQNSSGFFDGTLKVYWGKLSDTGMGGENFNGARPSLEVTLFTQAANGEYGYAKFAVNAEVKNPNNNFALPIDPPNFSANPPHPISGVTATFADFLPNVATGQADTTTPPLFDKTYTNVLLIRFHGTDRVAYMRVRPLYNKASMAFEPFNNFSGFPPTGTYRVTSQGSSGDATRAVQVTKSTPSLPPVFDFALFNGSSSQVGK